MIDQPSAKNYRIILEAPRRIPCLLVILLLASFCPGYSQKGFFIRDGAASYNINIKDQGADLNGLSCIVYNRKSQTVYTPDQIDQYGFGTVVYQSWTIRVNDTPKRVFLLRLFRGKVSLYSFTSRGRERFFIARGDTSDLEEYSHELLSRFVADCPQALANVKFVTPTRGALLRFVRDQNGCSDKPFSRFRYGVLAGYSATQQLTAQTTGVLYRLKLPVVAGLTFGAFMDKPIGAGHFSFHPELLYRRNALAVAFKNQELDYDLLLTTSTLSAPLMIQYVLPGVHKRGFLEGGLIYARTLKNESSLLRYQNIGNTIITEIDDRLLVPRNQVAYVIGAGIRLDTKKHYWLLEGRYSGLLGFSYNADQMNIKELTFALARTF